MDFNKWLEKNNAANGYAHFDNRVTLKSVLNKLQNHAFISKYDFMPFIHTTISFNKYHNDDSSIQKQDVRRAKNREIYYSSHFDKCIYQYYSFLINEQYNIFSQENNLDSVVVAYRNNLVGKSTIHFAYDAINKIKSLDKCFIIVGDFKNFFDELEHDYLKNCLCQLLNLKRLPDDWFAVFKHITKYNWVELADVLSYNGLENSVVGRRELNHTKIAMSMSQLRRYHALSQKSNRTIIHYNNKKYGIPQGSAISAVLANVYMMEFDRTVNEYILRFNGFYKRYSDDTIFVLPYEDEDEFKQHYDAIMSFVNSVPRLTLQPEKTKIYKYNDRRITNINNLIGQDNTANIIDYLGFSFDGINTRIRDKTVGKYYYRAYRKADGIVEAQKQMPNKHIIGKRLYAKYSLKGAKCHKGNSDTKQKQDKGNFLTYLKRCKRVFGKTEQVSRIINVHYGKLKKRLNKANKN